MLALTIMSAYAFLPPAGLQCEFMTDPLGIDVPHPRLSWKSPAGQSAYEIRVSDGSRVIWDSGQRRSPDCYGIPYEGPALEDGQEVFWRVRVWATSGMFGGGREASRFTPFIPLRRDLRRPPRAVSDWSKPATWTDGIAPGSWKAHWIGSSETSPTLLFRKNADLASKPVRAVCFVCGLGQYQLTINGRPVTSNWLSPSWTQYQKTCVYDTHDVTALLRAGANRIGIVLGNGMYDMSGDTRGSQQPNKVGDKKLIFQMRVWYADGRSSLVVSDDSWQTHAGPETYSGEFGGEDWDNRLYDASWDSPSIPSGSPTSNLLTRRGRRERRRMRSAILLRVPTGSESLRPLRLCEKPSGAWAAARGSMNSPVYPTHEESDWQPAVRVSPPTGALRGVTRSAPPLKTFLIQTPQTQHYLSPGAVVYDLAQNAPYVPEIVAEGQRGDSVTMWPSEALYPNGDIDQRTMRAGKKCTYTLSGNGEESWHPLFWYCGSRYWKVETKDANGNPIPVNQILKSFRGLLVHGSEPETGDFKCSNDTFNRIYQMVHWSMCGNFSNVVSDCPHREKSGWLEQLNMMGPDLMYCYDMRKMFDKAVHDMADAQHADGRVPTMAPEYFFYSDGYSDSVEWGGSFILVADFMKTWYGDDEPIRTQYPAMVRYVDYLQTRAEHDILAYGLGDWVGYGADKRTYPALTGTAYYYKIVRTLSGFARYLGKSSDAHKFDALAERIRQHFNKAFYDPKTGKYGLGSQSSQATALDFGLVDPDQNKKVFNQLVSAIEAQDYGISLGEAGHGPFLRTLTDHGRADLVAKVHLQSKLPGYVYLLNKGFTTMAETWDGGPISWNHFMLGQIVEWFYGDLLGIQPDPDSPGFKHFFIEPHPVSEVNWAEGHYDSVRGRIEVSWRMTEGHGTDYRIVVPPGCSATFRPDPMGGNVELGGGSHFFHCPRK